MNSQPKLESLLLTIHRRNGGQLQAIDFSLPLLHPSLQIDSLDLAEIMVAVEREFGVSPFEAPVPPKTWDCINRMLSQKSPPPA